MLKFVYVILSIVGTAFMLAAFVTALQAEKYTPLDFLIISLTTVFVAKFVKGIDDAIIEDAMKKEKEDGAHNG